MDVEELLRRRHRRLQHLNIQHVESLNDVVARITRIRVRETVPDSVIDHADDVELIDLTPDDLVRRLREGKVYLPQHAERAIRHYFQPGNLTALRELALRRTAQRVDEQMVHYMRAHAIQRAWRPASASSSPSQRERCRLARALCQADRRPLRAPWTALHVETSRSQRLSDAERDRIGDAMRLAERLGGEAVTVPGRTWSPPCWNTPKPHFTTSSLPRRGGRAGANSCASR